MTLPSNHPRLLEKLLLQQSQFVQGKRRECLHIDCPSSSTTSGSITLWDGIRPICQDSACLVNKLTSAMTWECVWPAGICTYVCTKYNEALQPQEVWAMMVGWNLRHMHRLWITWNLWGTKMVKLKSLNRNERWLLPVQKNSQTIDKVADKPDMAKTLVFGQPPNQPSIKVREDMYSVLPKEDCHHHHAFGELTRGWRQSQGEYCTLIIAAPYHKSEEFSVTGYNAKGKYIHIKGQEQYVSSWNSGREGDWR